MQTALCLSSSAVAGRSPAIKQQRNAAIARPAAARRAVMVRAEGEAEAPKGVEKQGPNMKALKDIQEIMDILPHRFPFLLVDRVLEWEYGKYAVGYKCVTVNDNFFPGHFPQRAIMPGVLQVEAMAQLGGIAMIDPTVAAQQNNFFFGGVDKCRWRKPVVPGDVLMMRVDVTKFNKKFGICKMDAKAYVGEDVVCEAELTLVMGK
ncbi:beta-hydroxyacyl-ACP dehydratase [Micractinium conductrix]|uniref:3-hydroxyacyl-[acyl-carrier-protein] dehydratase n=1 Tax=Micractinium conductrix TaxID=554055 RepID=A0A2P6VI58_9CHLO|nr:beta-hydroxyacyl-ACP dehydratase [Micractinium conductrix]|eukprot:PSC73775.1 beta-hydroxyacyl-ACP dehydratase [Micractinium conductrix]